jgi:hypothetical protein
VSSEILIWDESWAKVKKRKCKNIKMKSSRGATFLAKKLAAGLNRI